MEPCSIREIKTAGVGLRMPHAKQLLQDSTRVPWLECLIDNWLYDGGEVKQYLDRFASLYPLAFHGVGLSIASPNPVNLEYLKKVKKVLDETHALCYSEHLSFSESKESFIPDLLPFNYSKENLNFVADKVEQVQNYLNRQMLLENISRYISFEGDDYSEEEFLNLLVQKTGCGILLDLNNVYVNQVNLGLDAKAALKAIPFDSVYQIHLGGHDPRSGYVVDAHNNPVCESVWELYRSVIKEHGPIATLIEWDNDLPEFEVLMKEQSQAKEILEAYEVISE